MPLSDEPLLRAAIACKPIPIRFGRRRVNSLLYPAIAFMNRLSFGMKFSLVSVLFFVPMLLSNYYGARVVPGLRRHANGAAESGTARFDPAGTAQHGGLEGLVRIESIIGQTGNVEALGTRLSRIEAELSAQLQALAPVSDAPEQVAEFNARRDELVAGLRAAQAEQSLQSRRRWPKRCWVSRR